MTLHASWLGTVVSLGKSLRNSSTLYTEGWSSFKNVTNFISLLHFLLAAAVAVAVSAAVAVGAAVAVAADVAVAVAVAGCRCRCCCTTSTSTSSSSSSSSSSSLLLLLLLVLVTHTKRPPRTTFLVLTFLVLLLSVNLPSAELLGPYPIHPSTPSWRCSILPWSHGSLRLPVGKAGGSDTPWVNLCGFGVCKKKPTLNNSKRPPSKILLP